MPTIRIENTLLEREEEKEREKKKKRDPAPRRNQSHCYKKQPPIKTVTTK